MGNDITTPLEWAAVVRSSEGVVHDQWYTMLVSHLCEALYVEDVTTWVRDCLTEETLCIWTELLLDTLVIPFWVDECALDTELLQSNAEEVESTTIYIVGCDEMVASLTDIEDSVEVSCLTRACENCTNTAFEGCNLLCHSIVGWVCQTSVEITAVLEVEQTSHLVAGVILECCALINW